MQPVDYSIGILPWIFLGGGLLVGLVTVLRVRTKRPERSADLDLLRADLIAQRDQYLARLAGHGVEEVNSEDKRLLQLQTAKVLQQLDGLPAAAEPSFAEGSLPETQSAQPAKNFWARHPALTGALLGGGIVALVVTLILVAIDEAAPRAEMTATAAESRQPSSSSNATAMPGSANQPALPPFLQQQVDQMRATLENEPADITTRRRLALTLLSADRAFDAFQQANIILQTAPKDPEALYITGFVRYIMGQPEEAIARFERAIAERPDYAQAWLVKGLIQLQLQERAEAIATWEQGIAAAGGVEPRLEYLIRQAKTSKTVAEILAEPPPN